MCEAVTRELCLCSRELYEEDGVKLYKIYVSLVHRVVVQGESERNDE